MKANKQYFFILEGRNIMIKVTLTVNYMGKNYITNVLASKNTSEDEIRQLALEQVKKQWSH